MSTIKLVKGDELPALVVYLKDSNTGEPGDPDSWDPIDLSLSTTLISLELSLWGSITPITTLPMSKITDGSDGGVTLVDWQSFLDNAAATYQGEIKVDFNGDVQTVYDKIRIKLRE